MRLKILRTLGLIKPEEEKILRQTSPFLPSTYKYPRLSTEDGLNIVELDFS